MTGAHLLALQARLKEAILRLSDVQHWLRIANADLASEGGAPVDGEAARQALAQAQQVVEAMPLDARLGPSLKAWRGIESMEPFSRGLLYDAVTTRMVDNFLTYLSDLVALLLTTRPETLRSAQTVTLKEVLDHPDQESFIAWHAERTVSALSYKGLAGIEEFTMKKFGLSIVQDEKVKRDLNELIAIRNLVVHRRGVIDARFIQAVGTSFGEIGDRVHSFSSWEGRENRIDAPFYVVARLDAEAASKFSLDYESMEVPSVGTDHIF